ncbi:MAG: hypothetical protein IKB72_00015 [Ruminococcus sp.]|nr:hypothetical protein [Oscillospiraceae bacterium]MBR2723823.1 hypothetical protein [Ruminococcus sp.]
MLKKIKEIIKSILPSIDISQISESTRFSDDLCFDSINMMVFSIELEETFCFKFSHPVVFETLGDVCGYLDSRI